MYMSKPSNERVRLNGKVARRGVERAAYPDGVVEAPNGTERRGDFGRRDRLIAERASITESSGSADTFRKRLVEQVPRVSWRPEPYCAAVAEIGLPSIPALARNLAHQAVEHVAELTAHIGEHLGCRGKSVWRGKNLFCPPVHARHVCGGPVWQSTRRQRLRALTTPVNRVGQPQGVPLREYDHG